MGTWALSKRIGKGGGGVKNLILQEKLMQLAIK